jgi:hypothetical protein
VRHPTVDVSDPRPVYRALLAFGQRPDVPPGWLSGQFIPYRDARHHVFEDDLAAFNAAHHASVPNPCDHHYPTHAEYLVAVRAAAWYAVSQRWMLPEDVEGAVATGGGPRAGVPGLRARALSIRANGIGPHAPQPDQRTCVGDRIRLTGGLREF